MLKFKPKVKVKGLLCLPPYAGYPEIVIGRKLDLAGPTVLPPFPASATKLHHRPPASVKLTYIVGNQLIFFLFVVGA